MPLPSSRSSRILGWRRCWWRRPARSWAARRSSCNFEYPAIPEVQAIVAKARRLVSAAGIEIVTAEVSPSRLETELRAGRRFDLAYRVLRCDEPVFDAGMLLCPGYDAPPEADALASAASPRILAAPLAARAGPGMAHCPGTGHPDRSRVARRAAGDPALAAGRPLRLARPSEGTGKVASELYQGIETWEIMPWIARDPWDAH